MQPNAIVFVRILADYGYNIHMLLLSTVNADYEWMNADRMCQLWKLNGLKDEKIIDSTDCW